MADPIPVKPDHIDKWAFSAPASEKLELTQDVMDNGKLAGQTITNTELNHVLDNFSQNIIYLDYFVNTEFENALQVVTNQANSKVISGCDFRIPLTGKTINTDLGYVSCVQAFQPWFDPNTETKFPKFLGGNFTVIDAAGTDWQDLGDGSGVMAPGVAAFAPGVSLYFFVFTDEDDQFVDLIGDTNIAGGFAHTAFINYRSIDPGKKVFMRRIGSNSIYNDAFDRLVSGFSIKGKFYTQPAINTQVSSGPIAPGTSVTYQIGVGGLNLCPTGMDEYETIIGIASDGYLMKGEVRDPSIKDEFFSFTQREPLTTNPAAPFDFKQTFKYNSVGTSIRIFNDAGGDILNEVDMQINSWIDSRE